MSFHGCRFFCLALALLLLTPFLFADDVPNNVPNDVGAGVSSSSNSTPTDVDWNRIIKASSRFLVVQHAFRMATEPGTRSELKGPFMRDYLSSVRRINGWGDSDTFLVNYIGHPMMGSVTNYIYIQNTPGGHENEIGKSSKYWKKTIRAMAYSAAYSAQFELGPVSEASLGNVGIDYRTMGAVDLVVTPIAGTGWMVAEDVVDRFLITRIERLSSSAVLRGTVRILLNPARAFANLMNGSYPWHRSRPLSGSVAATLRLGK